MAAIPQTRIQQRIAALPFAGRVAREAELANVHGDRTRAAELARKLGGGISAADVLEAALSLTEGRGLVAAKTTAGSLPTQFQATQGGIEHGTLSRHGRTAGPSVKDVSSRMEQNGQALKVTFTNGAQAATAGYGFAVLVKDQDRSVLVAETTAKPAANGSVELTVNLDDVKARFAKFGRPFPEPLEIHVAVTDTASGARHHPDVRKATATITSQQGNLPRDVEIRLPAALVDAAPHLFSPGATAASQLIADRVASLPSVDAGVAAALTLHKLVLDKVAVQSIFGKDFTLEASTSGTRSDSSLLQDAATPRALLKAGIAGSIREATELAAKLAQLGLTARKVRGDTYFDVKGGGTARIRTNAQQTRINIQPRQDARSGPISQRIEYGLVLKPGADVAQPAAFLRDQGEGPLKPLSGLLDGMQRVETQEEIHGFTLSHKNGETFEITISLLSVRENVSEKPGGAHLSIEHDGSPFAIEPASAGAPTGPESRLHTAADLQGRDLQAHVAEVVDKLLALLAPDVAGRVTSKAEQAAKLLGIL